MSYIPNCYYLLATLALLTYRSEADSCCREDGCGQSCPWNDACNDGLDHNCKDRIAGPFKCQDRSQCHLFDTCDVEEASLRAGHQCASFPYYNGGYPLDILEWDNEDERYGCTAGSPDGKYCARWFTREDSPTECEIGDAVCQEVSANGNYCESWFIEQEEYDKCFYGYVAYDDDGASSYTVLCCTADNAYAYPECSSPTCSGSIFNGHPVQYEYASCYCTEESSNGMYCASWYCEEYQYLGQTFDNGLELEHYTCIAESENTQYCDVWNGNIDSVEEFELSRCKCETASSNGSYCDLWNCFEKGMDYYWPNILWVLFSIIMGSVPSILFIVYGCNVGWYSDDMFIVNLFYICGLIVWSGGFNIIGLWKAGVFVFLVAYGAHLLPLIIYCTCIGYSKWNAHKTEFNQNRVGHSHQENKTVEMVDSSALSLDGPAPHVALAVPSAPYYAPVMTSSDFEYRAQDRKDVRSELEMLKSYLSEGLISQEIYDKKVEQVIQRI